MFSQGKRRAYAVFPRRGGEETQQCIARVAASGLVFHVEEVAGALDAAEVAVAHVFAELLGVLGGGVFVPFTVHEQYRDVDDTGRAQGVVQVVLEHLVDVEVHLLVFVVVQAADMPVVEALEQ